MATTTNTATPATATAPAMRSSAALDEALKAFFDDEDGGGHGGVEVPAPPELPRVSDPSVEPAVPAVAARPAVAPKVAAARPGRDAPSREELLGRAREFVLRGWVEGEIAEILHVQYGVRVLECLQVARDAFDEVASKDVDIQRNAPKNLAMAMERLTYLYKLAIEHKKVKRKKVKGSNGKLRTVVEETPDPDIRNALEALKALHRIQRLEGPKNLLQVGIVFPGGDGRGDGRGVSGGSRDGRGEGSSGGPIPIDSTTSTAELIETAKARGLPVPQVVLDDLRLRDLAIEAGRKGETIVLTEDDARKLREGRG